MPEITGFLFLIYAKSMKDDKYYGSLSVISSYVKQLVLDTATVQKDMRDSGKKLGTQTFTQLPINALSVCF